MKTIVPKPEDAAAAISIRPVQEPSAASHGPQSQPLQFLHSSYSSSSASLGMSWLAPGCPIHALGPQACSFLCTDERECPAPSWLIHTDEIQGSR